MFKLKKKASQAGMTLIEILVVIAIGTLIIVGGLALFGTASEKQRVSNEVRNLGTIISGINSLYSGSADYNGLSGAVIVQSGAIPSTMFVGSGASAELVSPWGDITIAPDAANSNRSYTVTYEDVPAEACVGVIAGTLNSFEEITVDGTPVTNAGLAASTCADGSLITFTAR